MKNKMLLSLWLLAAAMPALAEDKIALGSGFDYSSGKYGNSASTDILYVPLIGQYETGALTLKLTIPFLSVTGPGGVIRGFGRVSVPGASAGNSPRFGRPVGSTTANSTNSGLGDVVAAADYAFYAAGPLSLDAVGKIKFGTGDAEQGLGTGQNDYSLQLDGYYAIDPQLSAFATAGYKIVGAPAGISVNDVAFGTLGADLELNDVTHVGAMFDYVEKATDAGSDQDELTFYAMLKLSETVRLQGNVSKGFSDGSPDYGVGVTLKAYFPPR